MTDVILGSDRNVDEHIPDKERAFHHHLREAYAQMPNPFVEDDDGGAFPIKLLDGKITRFDGKVISVDIWQEDERDVCVCIVPSRNEVAFTDSAFELVKQQSDRVFRQVFGRIEDLEAHAHYFGFRTGEGMVRRYSSKIAAVSDMFEIRMVHLFRKPLGAKMTIEALVTLDKILAGTEPRLP